MRDQPIEPHATAARVPGENPPSAPVAESAFGEIAWAEIPPPPPPADEGTGAPQSRSGRRAPRTDWRLGGRTVLRWREWLIAASLLALGAGVLCSAALAMLNPAGWTAIAASIVPLVAMLVVVVWAFSMSRPAGLLRVRGIDVLYGLVLGGALRVVQGWLSAGDAASGAFPSLLRVDGRVPAGTWITDVLAPVTVAPVIEELFFRGVLLVSVYTVLRRPLGKVSAGVVAVVVSTLAFAIAHSLAAGSGAVVGVALLGLVCALLVMLTGRIWGAVLVHIVYNAMFVALALVGTFWG
ncbi:CPBP family intramembrane glutamic endopeptidase [Microbacterium kyungheense]|nr:type II CAAX endopeptidase family protein [Microbacterium kyungheense]